MLSPDKLDEKETRLLTQLKQVCESANQVHEFAQKFCEMIRLQQLPELPN
jgi:hypothetical protein